MDVFTIRLIEIGAKTKLNLEQLLTMRQGKRTVIEKKI